MLQCYAVAETGVIAYESDAREGMIVTTGSYCGIVEVPVGEMLTFTYGNLGGLSAAFTTK